ncbi:MAG TPA: hypothetical protein VK164_06180 [Flavobacterium sp.]|uniref:hypothetical protein n=1 Tax=Flavobacterium sp. TaxID=239 RepID=UPI002B4B6B59|nr:hypothetical protein [Flavobacterium sp.]HLO73506.1 hypothetical protein [Flavobacterium sp.]
MKKIISELRKFYYKRTNKEKYYEYKQAIKDEKILKLYHNNFKSKIDAIETALIEKEEINFKHSGHIGDLIYALPVIKEISKTKKCNLYIKINHSIGEKNYYKHPSGNVMISDRIFDMVVPLLKKQDYIHAVQNWDNEEIDIDLDLFRDFPFSSNFHSIRWYYHITGFQPDMNSSFIDAKPSEEFKDKIVVVRTFRGRNPMINYSFLRKYDNLLFLGIKSEYEDFVKEVPNTDFYDVKNFLELAEIMKASKFVIANQTFAFALAEGLKVNRILEANPFIPAVFPVGDNGFDFYFQNQFEKLVEKFDN